ncbi:MAG: protein translocase subunit SecF [Pseudomonadota bacterium]
MLETFSINFMVWRKLFLTLSLLLMIASIAVLGVRGLNFGVDFRGGTSLVVSDSTAIDIADWRGRIAPLALGEVTIQNFGGEDAALIRVQRQPGDETEQLGAVERIRDVLPETISVDQIEFVGPTVGEELLRAGIIAVALSLIAVSAYIWIRFEWRYSVATLTALAHDIISTIGLFALSGFEFSLATVAALMTIAGYSINDTVVVFDRVRENRRKYKKGTLIEIINRSLNDTLARTVVTSLTTLLALLALVTFGGPIVRNFSWALIWGVLIGTYSSLLVAAPVLLWIEGGEDTPRGKSEESAPAKDTPSR